MTDPLGQDMTASLLGLQALAEHGSDPKVGGSGNVFCSPRTQGLRAGGGEVRDSVNKSCGDVYINMPWRDF